MVFGPLALVQPQGFAIDGGKELGQSLGGPQHLFNHRVHALPVRLAFKLPLLIERLGCTAERELLGRDPALQVE